MFIFRTTGALRRYLDHICKNGKKLGFVPTMGALHQGHLSLVDTSITQTDITVVSIFVNPTQFNEQADLDKYPRTLAEDLEQLQDRGCHVVFVPEADQIYPPGLDTMVHIDLAGLDQRMEGKFRPGHFIGVVQVVKRLLDIVQPDAMFMGQKDFQQLAVVRHMIAALDLSVEVIMCPTMREAHGLAMSSRNLLLSEDLRQRASIIYETLVMTKGLLNAKPTSELQAMAIRKITLSGFDPEYFEIVDGHDLQPVVDVAASDYIIACCAVRTAGIRLIDNMVLKEPEN